MFSNKSNGLAKFASLSNYFFKTSSSFDEETPPPPPPPLLKAPVIASTTVEIVIEKEWKSRYAIFTK